MQKADVSGRFEKKRFEKLLADTKVFHEQTVEDIEAGRDTTDPVCYNITWMELMSRVEDRLQAIGSVF